MNEKWIRLISSFALALLFVSSGARAQVESKVDASGLLSPGRYTTTKTVDLSQVSRLSGAGWSNNSNFTQGDHHWDDVRSGTVIKCAPSASPCVYFQVPPHAPMPIRIANIAIVGPGSGVGLQIGNDAPRTPVFGSLDNVLVANFGVGIKFYGEDFTFTHLILQGNSTGMILYNAANENAFIGLRLQHNSTGLLAAGEGLYELNFFGGLIQSNGVGIDLGSCNSCSMQGFDIEGNSKAGVIMRGGRGGSNVLTNLRLGGGLGDIVSIEGGSHNLLVGNRSGGRNHVIIGPGAAGTVLVGNNFNGMIDKGSGTLRFGSVIQR
jgi:hypothetical protein